MMAQPNIQSVPAPDSGVYETPQESPIARLQARMLKMKHVFFSTHENLDEDDEATLREMAQLKNQEEQDEAYDKWILKQHAIKQLEAERKLIEANLLAMRDTLTEIGNRRYFEDQMSKVMSEIEREHRDRENGKPHRTISIGLITLDMDHFKAINDTLGHKMGDNALQEFVAIVDSMHRPYDTFARVGGEEFFILLPDTSLEDTIAKAEKVREKVEAELKKRLLNHCQTENERKAVLSLAGTVSVGVTSYSTEEARKSDKELIKEADDALYESKHTGRNKVTVYGKHSGDKN